MSDTPQHGQGRAGQQPVPAGQGQPANQPPQGVAPTGHRHAADPGFLGDRVVRWTILRHIGAFFLLNLCLGLLVMVFPNLVRVLGLAAVLPPEVTGATGVTALLGGMGKLVVATFAFLVFLAGAPVFSAILGVSTGSRGGTSTGRLTAAAGIGSFLGYAIPFTLLLLVVAAGIPFAPLQPGSLIVSGILVGIPNGIAAAGMTYLTAP